MRESLVIFEFLASVFIISCSSDQNADILKADWSGINLTGIDYKIGDYVYLKDSNYFYTGIVLDFDKDGAGIWMGICFTNYKDTIKPDLNSLDNCKLFGRQIPSGLINTTCIDCFDLAYLNESGLKRDTSIVGLIGNVAYDNEKIKISAYSPSYDIPGLINFYNIGIIQRQKTPDDCKESKFKVGAITERYFDFDMIKND